MDETRKIKKGDRVVFLNEAKHREKPRYYPPVGTVGQVLADFDHDSVLVEWPKGSTSMDGRWHALIENVAPVQTDDTRSSERSEAYTTFAKEAHGQYAELVNAGFTEEQAWEMVKIIVSGNAQPRPLFGR